MTPPATEPAETAWRTGARQQRSRDTESAVIRAAAALLAERPFDTIRVADIARQAGISVGGFYRRFRDKRALLHLADQGFLDDCARALDEALSAPRVAGLALARVVHAYVSVMIDKFREHRVAILQVMRHASPADAEAYRRRAALFNARAHGRFRALIRERGAEISHPDPETAMNLAIFFASAAARDAVWRGSLAAYPIAVSDRELADEITRSFLAYLGAA